jgi:hypothetical protein
MTQIAKYKNWKAQYFCTVKDWKIELLTLEGIESLPPLSKEAA